MDSAVFTAIAGIIQQAGLLGIGIVCCVVIAKETIRRRLGQVGGQGGITLNILSQLRHKYIVVIGKHFFLLIRAEHGAFKLGEGGTEFIEAINHQKALAHREHVVVEEVEVILDRLRAAVAQGNQLIRDRSGEHFAANVVTNQAGEQQAQQAGQQHHGQHLGLHTQLAEEFDHHGGRKIGS